MTADEHRATLTARFTRTRDRTTALCAPLAVEDQVVQSMPDTSPPKWHLAHTTWFFEELLLRRHAPGFIAPHPEWDLLTNSYYESLGPRWPREQRGLLSRPTVAQIMSWRHATDDGVRDLVGAASERRWAEIGAILELGIHHEEQHQELLVTDIKHILGTQPLRPAYRPSAPPRLTTAVQPLSFFGFSGGIHEIGWEGSAFSFDNERPRHRVLLRDFELAERVVTNRDVLRFIDDGGYREPRHWLSDGWAIVRERGWQAPLYWEEAQGGWRTYTLEGMAPVVPDEPSLHLSFYESDAMARHAGYRLPTEAEWEVAASLRAPQVGALLDDDHLHPLVEAGWTLWGNVWEWTSSPYQAYPGFRPFEGELAEYNGKFMANQMVLRGGSAATPRDHLRATYRNFWHPDRRFQLTGSRWAR
jgi:ergothioneine biosynthesis protein EgtB